MALNKNAKAWVKALRSRKYRQTTGALAKDGKFCCLGVACELAVKAGIIFPAKGDTYGGCWASLPGLVANWLGIADSEGVFTTRDGSIRSLIVLNDDEQKKFYQIANLIESEPQGLFE
jgi:hypothetical protein